MTNKTKSFSIRTDTELIEKFNKACLDLPIAFKPRNLIESYMNYIIEVSSEYKQTGDIKLGFITGDRGDIILYSESSKSQGIAVLDKK